MSANFLLTFIRPRYKISDSCMISDLAEIFCDSYIRYDYYVPSGRKGVIIYGLYNRKWC